MTTEERIARLEAQLERLETREAELRAQLMRAQLDQWYARIEDLEVQAHLGAMETNDRVLALVGQLRSRWDEAKSQLDGATASAADLVDSMRNGIESLLKDARRVLMDAKPARKS